MRSAQLKHWAAGLPRLLGCLRIGLPGSRASSPWKTKKNPQAQPNHLKDGPHQCRPTWEVSHGWELFHQFAEGWQLVSERRSSGRAEVDHQWALRAGKVRRWHSVSITLFSPGHVQRCPPSGLETGTTQRGGGIFTQFLVMENEREARPHEQCTHFQFTLYRNSWL